MATVVETASLSGIFHGRLSSLAVAVAALIIVCWSILPRIANALRLASIPVIGSELGNTQKRRLAYLSGAQKLYIDGYKKFKNGVFRVTTSRASDVLVLSPIFLKELSRLPDSILSMAAAIDEGMETKYTKIETTVPIIPHTVARKLTPSLPRLNPILHQEVLQVLDLELPVVANEWREYPIQKTLTRVVAMVSGRIFVGPGLGRSDAYLDAAINYTLDVVAAQRSVQQLQPWQRPFLAQRLPAVKKLDRRIKEADAFLRPLAESRRQEAKSATAAGGHDDFMQWLVENQDKYKDANSQNLAKVQLGVSFAAIHTTTMSVTNAFYSIAAMPELVPELRAEMDDALSANGGVFTTSALQSMKKLDSFLKETLRMNPASMASFQRKVLQPFKLSSGQAIPAGVIVEIPAIAINFDPEIFPNPDTFDALRFCRTRQDAKSVAAHIKNAPANASALEQFVSVNPTSLSFGFGRHACPGRFFAANEIKMILACVLQRCDIKMADGRTERYPNIEFAHLSIPDPSRKLLFKARET